MNTVNCPICQGRITLSAKVEFLDRVTCPSCEALLEVIGTSPPELDWIYYDDYDPSMSRQQSKNQGFAKCPLCRENIHIGSDRKAGTRIFCPGCDAQLELVSIMPLELDWPFDDGHDYYSPDEDLIYHEYDH